ncbi:MAG: hypothetical protein IPK26_08865 [Planctomycetes bacterium]|nr:hypothetical protein [Planctomycetota bacterium]
MTAPYGLQAFGLPLACQGQVPMNGLLTVATQSNPFGYAYSFVPVPAGLMFNNFTISSQAVILDPLAPGGLVVSNADQIRFGITPPAAIAFSQGSATAPTGLVYADQGVVTFFN